MSQECPITDDPDWSEYMQDNEMLRNQLRGRVQTEAQEALDNHLVTGTAQGEFDERFSAKIENGEGIVGYQYLHGTERNAGHFQFDGKTEVRPRGDGTYEVTVNSGYTWNDRIDPTRSTRRTTRRVHQRGCASDRQVCGHVKWSLWLPERKLPQGLPVWGG